jgi:hypothetical protein
MAAMGKAITPRTNSMGTAKSRNAVTRGITAIPIGNRTIVIRVSISTPPGEDLETISKFNLWAVTPYDRYPICTYKGFEIDSQSFKTGCIILKSFCNATNL